MNGTKNGGGYATMGNLTLTLPAGTYYAKAFVISGTTTNEISLYVNNGTSDISGTLLGTEKSFTLESETTLQFRFAVWNDGTVLTNYTVGIVISKTSGIDKFYPYTNICPISGHTEVNTIVSPTQSASDGTTYTTTLGRTVYGGTLDVVSGELVVDRAMVDLGTLNWVLNASTHRATSLSLNGVAKAPLSTAIPANMIAEKYECVKATSTLTVGTFAYLRISGSSDSLIMYYDGVNAPSGNLVYELATPQTIQLTPQEVKLLLGTNNIWSDGNVTLVYSADIQKWVEKKLNGNSTTLTMSRPMTAELNETETETTETEETE